MAALEVAAGAGEVWVPEVFGLALESDVEDVEGGGDAGAFAAFSLNAAAVCVLEGFTASTAPCLHRPPASSKNQIGSVLLTVIMMVGRPGASTGRLSST